MLHRLLYSLSFSSVPDTAPITPQLGVLSRRFIWYWCSCAWYTHLLMLDESVEHKEKGYALAQSQ